jgi:tetratricopeptide (TPR) repeat protein
LDHRHGGGSLADVLAYSPALAGEIAGIPEAAQAPLSGWVFLDLETTGLAGGAGTLGFLVGLGAFVEEGFRLRQYFLRDPAQEPGMLHALLEDLEPASGFVTFNGRAFDIPLLEMRYQLGLRRRWRLGAFPQLDLLYPARRLWRRGLPDCRLGTLEGQVLGVERTEADVPGELIPGLYADYLRTGDATELGRVIYHNAQDILSLVGLAAAVLGRHQPGDLQSLSGEEALAVARWHQSQGREAAADQAYRASLQGGTAAAIRVETLRSYGAYLKSQGRRDQALQGWEEWHTLDGQDPTPCVELAKYYEWAAGDAAAAHHWTLEGLLCLSRWPAGWQKDRARESLEHRLKRLERKLEEQAGLKR